MPPKARTASRRRSSSPKSGPSIRDAIAQLLGERASLASRVPQFLRWPPDAFAVAAYLLEETGAYISILSNWPPRLAALHRGPLGGKVDEMTGRRWVAFATDSGKEWRSRATPDVPKSAPPLIGALWQEVRAVLDEALNALPNHKDAVTALICLLTIADDASEGVGVPERRRGAGAKEGEEDDFMENAAVRLWATGYIGRATLCRWVQTDRVVVLPKMRTPESGITIRSLSHHLALARSNVRAIWHQADVPIGAERHNALNLLVVPWPRRVTPMQFAPEPSLDRSMLPDRIDFFSFERRSDGTDAVPVWVELEGLVRQATKIAGKVDGIVFPEMSLSREECSRITERLASFNVNFLIAGVHDEGATPKAPRLNLAAIRVRLEDDGEGLADFEQSKHHRWFLDDRQIVQYGLGTRLDPTKKWWEYTEITERRVHFIALASWLAFSVLICEDLARPDPAGELIRAVGPNLLVALLQDGPQLAARWPGRSAAPLADDPGCSVLTVTSLGMTLLSRPLGGKPASRAVAMWRESGGDALELSLEPDADALLLCLVGRDQTQWTADGRDDGGVTGRIGLAGIHQVTSPTRP